MNLFLLTPHRFSFNFSLGFSLSPSDARKTLRFSRWLLIQWNAIGSFFSHAFGIFFWSLSILAYDLSFSRQIHDLMCEAEALHMSTRQANREAALPSRHHNSNLCTNKHDRYYRLGSLHRRSLSSSSCRWFDFTQSGNLRGIAFRVAERLSIISHRLSIVYWAYPSRQTTQVA